MILLDLVANRFNIPLRHSIYKGDNELGYLLISVKFTGNNIVATYGDLNDQFDVVIRGR